MFTIIFDSTRPAKVNRRFGRGLGRPTDAYGNVLPRVGYTAADAAWWASLNRDWHDTEMSTADLSWERAAAEAEAARRVESLGYL